MDNKKPKLNLLVILVLGIAGLLTAGFVFAQYDYYDPYSNSNVDYFPMNPINTSPSRTGGSTGGAGGKATSGGTGSGTAVGSTTNTTATPTCSNKPTANPRNTRSVEIRDEGGKVFYLSPPKEEVSGVKAHPESSQDIYKGETKVGLITVDNKCYPKYGYIREPPLSSDSSPSRSSVVTPPADIVKVDADGIPEDKTAANLDPTTGKVYDTKTGALIKDARYDATARKIYYRDSDSTFGTVLTDTTGYVNIDTRLHLDKTSVGSSSPPSYPFKPVKFNDVSQSDHSVSALVDFMRQEKTYTIPKNKKFGINKKVKGTFALQVLAAVSGAGCGSDTKYPGSKKCKEHLVRSGVVGEDFSLNEDITRGDFYALLLQTQNISLEDASEEDLRALCKDVAEPTKYAAQILVTAAKHGILKKYNGECRPLKSFSQKEAAEFAMKTLEAGANLARE